LQKSKVASVQIFGETLKREAIDDSDNLSRVTEAAYEFSLRRWGPSDLYTKSAPVALRIFDTFGKTTFATLSPGERHRKTHLPSLLCARFGSRQPHSIITLAFMSKEAGAGKASKALGRRGSQKKPN
jgi:hypothetical protein